MKHLGLVALAAALAIPTGQAARAQDRSAAPFAAFDAASEPVLRDPHDLTLGPDERLYVADKFANRIAIMDRNTLEVVGSFGEGELYDPRDIDFDAWGRAVVADTGNSRVAIFDLASDPPKLVATIDGVSRTEGAAVHPNGRIYATASGFGTITAYENGKLVASAGGLASAHDIAIDSRGDLWVADTGHRRIVKFSQELEVLTVLDDPKYGWYGPRYLAVDPFDRLIVVDQDAHRIVMIETDGSVAGVLGDYGPGEGPNKFDDPEGAAVVGSTYYFSDSDNDRIVRYQVVTN